MAENQSKSKWFPWLFSPAYEIDLFRNDPQSRRFILRAHEESIAWIYYRVPPFELGYSVEFQWCEVPCPDNYLYIQTLFVKQPHRRQGRGREMVRYLSKLESSTDGFVAFAINRWSGKILCHPHPEQLPETIQSSKKYSIRQFTQTPWEEVEI